MTKHLSLAAITLALLLAACGGGIDPASDDVQATIQAYYLAVQAQDVEAQAGYWLADYQADARRLAQAWARRPLDRLAITNFHLDPGDQSSQRIAHYELWVGDRRRPEPAAALVEKDGEAWRIRDMR